MLSQGVGRGFCAGADLGGLDSLATGATGAAMGSLAAALDTRGFLLTKRLSKPVIAAINGPVAGIGFAWALTCDVRFANRDAKFSCAFSKRGLVAEWGTSFLLPRLVGTGNAMMLLLSSEVFLGDEAHRLGLVQRVCDGDCVEQAMRFAQRLADGVSPTSLAVIKRQVWKHPLMDDEEALRQSTAMMKSSLTPKNADFKEGVQSFMQKRKPAFAPLSATNPVVLTMDDVMGKL